MRIQQAFRPSTTSAHSLHFKTFIAFLIFMDLPIICNVHNILAFMEFCTRTQFHLRSYQPISPPSTQELSFMAGTFQQPPTQLFSDTFAAYPSIPNLTPPPGVFLTLPPYIICPCHVTSSLIQFYSGLSFSQHFMVSSGCLTLAPHSSSRFNPSFHSLRQDLIFAPPGAHLLIKWTKTLQQHHKSYNWVQRSSIHNHFLCPVRALQALLASRPLPPSAPLFANNFSPYAQVIDTHIRDALKKVLTHRNISTRGHGFHTFRRSGTTLAFDNNIKIQDIMAHGLWKSSAIWTYLENASQAPSIIPTTFSRIIPSFI